MLDYLRDYLSSCICTIYMCVLLAQSVFITSLVLNKYPEFKWLTNNITRCLSISSHTHYKYDKSNKTFTCVEYYANETTTVFEDTKR